MQPSPLPADFMVRYTVVSGPVSPPYQWTYTVSLVGAQPDSFHAGLGLTRGWGEEWTEIFNISSADMTDLYSLMLEKNAFREHWEEDPDPPVGGGSGSLTALAQGRRASIPPWPIDTASADTIYARIRSLVPDVIWDTLSARLDRLHDQPARAGVESSRSEVAETGRVVLLR